MSDNLLYASYYARLYECLLLLSSNIETNPGPLSESEQTLLNAIKSSEARVLAEISDVKTESSTIKTEIPEVKSECSKTKTDLEKVKQTQTEMVKVKARDKRLKETVQLDIDQLHEEFENKLDMITDIDDELDRLERENRKSTMRIFGLAEEPDERNLDAKRIVTEKVLKVASSGEDWSPDDKQRAYRVGESKDGQPRLMLVTFRYCDDKFRVYDGRDILCKNGIRVSDDLVKRQRQKLNDLKAKGYTG